MSALTIAAPESAQDRIREADPAFDPGSAPEPETAPLRIGIDIRRLGDFGVGTCIKNLVHAPVITSNLSSLPEAVGDAAVLVNPENVFDIARGLQRVLLDESFREQLRRRGKEQAERFSWDRSARRVHDIYRRVSAAA